VKTKLVEKQHLTFGLYANFDRLTVPSPKSKPEPG